MKRVALYTRVSTNDGRQDVENQAHQLREYARNSGWEIVHEYSDNASGKASATRKQFQEMMKDASQRQFDILLVWALDRFSREGVAETFDHIKRLLSHGVQFVSFTEEMFRTTGPCGELMLAVAAWIAKQERIRISERTLAGLERARRIGRIGGRPLKVFDRDKARKLRAAGESYGNIAKAMALPKSTVVRILQQAQA